MFGLLNWKDGVVIYWDKDVYRKIKSAAIILNT